MSTRSAAAYAVSAVAVAATAVIGGRAVETGTKWYRTLDKPSWQPPSWAFGVVWTPLYASIAWAAGHALNRTEGPARREVAGAFAANLATNAAWTWLFFGRRSVLGGLAGTLALDVANADLIRRTARHDEAAAWALVPYAAWCLFATGLNASIAIRAAQSGDRGPGSTTR